MRWRSSARFFGRLMIAHAVRRKVAVILCQLVAGGTEVANGKVIICRPVSKKTAAPGKWTH